MPAAMSRKTVSLGRSVQHDLTVYALAAGAAGVSMLALAHPADAEVVYTPLHNVIGPKQTFAIDLNHDGITDFVLENKFHASHGSNWYVHWTIQGRPFNGAAAVSSGGRYHYAAALKQGATIGPQGPWRPSTELVEGENEEFGYSFPSGNWYLVPTAYLGLRFQINGEDHYGWVRITVDWNRTNLFAGVTGYAYETEPNTPIIAGDTGHAINENSEPKGELQVATPQPASSATLGTLSLGSGGLATWRRQ
jgi:hypothetical protein